MSWYTDGEEEDEGDPRRDASRDRQGERVDGRSITVKSDADDTEGKYSRDAPISFRESREQAKMMQEARESRGEAVEESPLPDLTESEATGERECASVQEPASEDRDDNVEDDVVDAEAFGQALRDKLQDGGLENVETLATGKSRSTEFELVSTTVDGESVFAMVSSASWGVAFQKHLGNFGTRISTPALTVDTEVIADAVVAERKKRKRQFRYREPDEFVSELSDEQLSAVAYWYREVTSEVLREAVLWSDAEREERDVVVSVVSGYVVVGGEEVMVRLEDALSDCLSETQIDVVLDAMPEAVASSEDALGGGDVRSVISRVSTLSGSSGCVVAGRLLFD